MKIIWVGLEGSGKSLRMAQKVFDISERNAKWFLKTGVQRPIYINTPLDADFVKSCELKNVPIIYWENLSELVGLQGGDLFMDEIGTYFDARKYAELSLDVRRWFAQADKSGVDIYGTAQDFAQIDIAFRRLVNELYYVWKIIGTKRPHRTKPERNMPFLPKIWGIHLEVEMMVTPSETGEYKALWKWEYLYGWFTCKKKFCDIYNTGAFVKMSSGVPLQHSERECKECGFKKIFHS